MEESKSFEELIGMDFIKNSVCKNCKNYNGTHCTVKGDNGSDGYLKVEPTGHCNEFDKKSDREIQENIEKEATEIFTVEGQVKDFENKLPLFYDKSGNFWLWCETLTKWERVDDITVLNMIQDRTGKDTISSKARTEILNALKQESRRRIPKPVKPTWIQFKNRIIDIETGEEFVASPNYFVTNPIPYELHKDRNSETPKMDKIFGEWVGKDYGRIEKF